MLLWVHKYYGEMLPKGRTHVREDNRNSGSANFTTDDDPTRTSSWRREDLMQGGALRNALLSMGLAGALARVETLFKERY